MNAPRTLVPDIIERVTHVRWPQRGTEQTDEAARQRWNAMSAAYQAQRIKEHKENAK